MDKDRVMEYVMNTPQNINPNVLGPMLDELSGGSGSGSVVHGTVNENTITLDKTWQEIYDGDYNSIRIELEDTVRVLNIFLVFTGESWYYVGAFYAEGSQGGAGISLVEVDFVTNSSDGYPSATVS